jgi:HAMP domain-containing protein
MLVRKAMRGARAASISSRNDPKTPEQMISPPIGPVVPLRSSPTGLDGAVGVREHTDWARDIEGDVERDITRLANLAVDDSQRDPSRTAEAHYRHRLGLLLNGENQRFRFGDIGLAPLPSTVEPSTPTHAKEGSGGKFHANYVTSYEFNLLSQKVESMSQLLKQLMDMHHESEEKIKVLQVDRDKAIDDITLVKAQVIVMRENLKDRGLTSLEATVSLANVEHPIFSTTAEQAAKMEQPPPTGD